MLKNLKLLSISVLGVFLLNGCNGDVTVKLEDPKKYKEEMNVIINDKDYGLISSKNPELKIEVPRDDYTVYLKTKINKDYEYFHVLSKKVSVQGVGANEVLIKGSLFLDYTDNHKRGIENIFTLTNIKPYNYSFKTRNGNKILRINKYGQWYDTLTFQNFSKERLIEREGRNILFKNGEEIIYRFENIKEASPLRGFYQERTQQKRKNNCFQRKVVNPSNNGSIVIDFCKERY